MKKYGRQIFVVVVLVLIGFAACNEVKGQSTAIASQEVVDSLEETSSEEAGFWEKSVFNRKNGLFLFFIGALTATCVAIQWWIKPCRKALNEVITENVKNAGDLLVAREEFEARVDKTEREAKFREQRASPPIEAGFGNFTLNRLPGTESPLRNKEEALGHARKVLQKDAKGFYPLEETFSKCLFQQLNKPPGTHPVIKILTFSDSDPEEVEVSINRASLWRFEARHHTGQGGKETFYLFAQGGSLMRSKAISSRRDVVISKATDQIDLAIWEGTSSPATVLDEDPGVLDPARTS